MFSALWDLCKRQEVLLAIVVTVFVVILSIISPNFASLQNIMNLLSSFSYMGILVAALLVVLIAGGIDISFAAVASVAQYVALSIANSYGIGWFGVILIACTVGASFGLMNGFLVYILRIPSIIITIATQSIIFGLLLTITKGQDIFMLPEWFSDGINIVFYTDSNGIEYALNLQIIALLLTLSVTWLLLNRINIGRQIFAFGSNPDAAERVGFNVFRLNLFVYGYMGFAAGIASIVLAQYNQSVSPTALVGKELDVIAAAFLGGASVTGGAGTIGGAVLGIALIAIMENGLTLLGISSYWSQFFTGIVIIAAVISMARDAQQRWCEAPGVA